MISGRALTLGLIGLAACGEPPFDPADYELGDVTCDYEPTDACELYVCALHQCYDEAVLNRPSTSELAALCGSWDTGAQPDYICAAEIWADGDCSTTTGLSEAVFGEAYCGIE